MDTTPVTPKKPIRPCPRCPHRLSDLWSHESPPESPSNPAQLLPKIPEAEKSNDDDNSAGKSGSTSVEGQVDQEHESEEEHKDDGEQKHSSFCNPPPRSCNAEPKYSLCDPAPPDAKTDLAAALKEKKCPKKYTCYGCRQRHGSTAQSESTKTYGAEEVGPHTETEMNGGVLETLRNGHTLLWKHCDRCIEIAALKYARDYDNPRLYELYVEVYGPFSERTDEGSRGPRTEQFEKWKESIDKALPPPRPEVVPEEAPTANGLDAVVEEAEES